jgi:hypothetical protein
MRKEINHEQNMLLNFLMQGDAAERWKIHVLVDRRRFPASDCFAKDEILTATMLSNEDDIKVTRRWDEVTARVEVGPGN